jgi:hypothetical protein
VTNNTAEFERLVGLALENWAVPAAGGESDRVTVTLSRERLPDGRVKRRIRCAVDRAHGSISLRALLQVLGLSPSRFHPWRRRQTACGLDDSVVLSAHGPQQLRSRGPWMEGVIPWR